MKIKLNWPPDLVIPPGQSLEDVTLAQLAETEPPPECPKCGTHNLNVLTRKEGGPSAICESCHHAFNF